MIIKLNRDYQNIKNRLEKTMPPKGKKSKKKIITNPTIDALERNF